MTTAHGLDHGRAQARLGGEQLVESAHPRDAGISAGGVDSCSVTYDLIADAPETG